MARPTRSATMKAMPRYLVTGCAGFIGSWITQTLVERGATVRGLDNFETGRSRKSSPTCKAVSISSSAICATPTPSPAPAKASTSSSIRELGPPSRDPSKTRAPATPRTSTAPSTCSKARAPPASSGSSMPLRLPPTATSQDFRAAKPWSPCRSRPIRCRNWQASST